MPPGDVTIDALPSTTVRVPRRFRWTRGVLRRTDESYEGAVSPLRRLFVGAAEKRRKRVSAHLMLPGGPSTQRDELPARRRAALGLIQPVHSSGTSLYPNRGEGSPLAASFCVRPNARAPSGNQVWCYGSPCRPLLACAGGGQHLSFVSTALPCREATLATFRQLIRRVHLRNLITTRFLCHFEVASSSGRHPSADATYNGTRWVVRL